MNSRLTLLFVCEQSRLDSVFLAEFRSADFQVLTARSLDRAKAILLTRSVNALVLCHDEYRDDRALAPQLKRIARGVPIFLFTDREQPRPDGIDSIWRFDPGDAALARAMAVFCHNLFQPTPAFRRSALAVGAVANVFAVRANHRTN